MKDLTLADFFANYPHITLASPDDNNDILDFYHRQSLSSAESEIIYARGNDFFSFLKERSDSFLVIIMRDDKNVMQGMGVLSFRPGHIDGKAVTVGYLGDLRIKMNRNLVREWRLMYANLMRLSPQMKEMHHCVHYQTVLIDENTMSKNNLAATKIPNLHYHRLTSYRMVNIIGHVKKNKYVFHFRFATSFDKNLIADFLSSAVKKSLFAHDWTLEFERRLKTWNNFDITNYLLCFDQKGNLLAVTSLWSPVETKQIHLTKIPSTLKYLHKILQVVPFVEVKKLPRPNAPLDILYVNQIVFEDNLIDSEKKMITNEIMHFSFKKNFHVLAYADFENENYLDGTKKLFMQKMQMALFSVHYKDDDNNIATPILWSFNDAAPTFDMSLV